MFAGHYFGPSNGSRGGERGFINRQLFSSLEKPVGLFAGGVENASDVEFLTVSCEHIKSQP